MSLAGSPSSLEAGGGWETVQVSCRSDYVYAQEPQRIRWAEEREMEVSEVLRQSLTPEGRRFLVRAGDRRVELLYRETEDLWLARTSSPPLGSAEPRGGEEGLG